MTRQVDEWLANAREESRRITTEERRTEAEGARTQKRLGTGQQRRDASDARGRRERFEGPAGRAGRRKPIYTYYEKCPREAEGPGRRRRGRAAGAVSGERRAVEPRV